MSLWVEEGKDAAAEQKKATKASVSTCFFASRLAAAKFRPATVVGRGFFMGPAKNEEMRPLSPHKLPKWGITAEAACVHHKATIVQVARGALAR